MGLYRTKLKSKIRQVHRTGKELRNGDRIDSEKLSEYLRWRPPASDRWFQRKWEAAGMKHEQDLFNYRFGGYIPDCLNTSLKYIIEVDGSFHERADQKLQDEQKDKFYLSKGLQVIRVKSYDETSFQKAVSIVKNLREPEEKRIQV